MSIETIKAFGSGFCEYYKEKFQNTSGVCDALKKTCSVADEGFSIMDKANPLNLVKDPIKNCSAKIDKYVSDGNPENLTIGEKLWNVTKGAGNVVDSLTSAKGLSITAGVIGTGGMLATAFPVVAATMAPTINAATTVTGVGLAAKGSYDTITADNEQEAQKAGSELMSGGMLITTAALTAKSSLSTAKSAGVDVANPEHMTTTQAMIENIKAVPKSIAKTAQSFSSSATNNAAIAAENITQKHKTEQVQKQENGTNPQQIKTTKNENHYLETHKDTAVSMHHDINGRNTYIREDISKGNITETIQEIDAEFAKLPPTEKPCVVYRGRSENPMIKRFNHDFEVLDNAKVGDVIVPDTGYSYCGFKRSLAENWGGHRAQQYSFDGSSNRTLIYEIKLPVGAKVSRNLEHGGEVVMPRGAQYKLLSKTTDEKGHIEAVLEYILPKD